MPADNPDVVPATASGMPVSMTGARSHTHTAHAHFVRQFVLTMEFLFPQFVEPLANLDRIES
jgi:hypothetical protein